MTAPETDNPTLMQTLEQLVAQRSHDAEFMAWKLATETTAAYINKNMYSVRMFTSPTSTARNDIEGRNGLLDHAVRSVASSGSFLQCGVRRGRTINFLANVISKDQIIHGFDSFEALPDERSFGRGKRELPLGGEIPRVLQNVRLHKGWPDLTLSPFFQEHPEPIAFLYLDADGDQMARRILAIAKSKFVPGTVIVFEEYFNFPGWEQFVFKAFQECIADTQLQYEYIGCAPRHYSVAVKLFART